MATTSSQNSRETAVDRVFDFLIERQTALFEAVRASADRNNRFNHNLIEGARQSAEDWTEVGRRWLDKPTDLISLWEGTSEAIGNIQQRNLSLLREWVETTVDLQRDNAEAIRRGFGDVRQVVETAQANAPEFLRRGWRRGGANGSEERVASTEA